MPHHVTAVAFHPETGQLNLYPDSSAYATQLRLITARIIATANSTAGTDAVRTVRILPPVPRPRLGPHRKPRPPRRPLRRLR
ncbi:DciA family protein [Streptomyces rimosus]|uniref:DciA family protein n=1 Tax=Streptomyces rimosus TaxID=1927 RepID=UPI002D219802|nr:DciA family protein [Streptomyces rimosus]